MTFLDDLKWQLRGFWQLDDTYVQLEVWSNNYDR